MIKLLFLNFFLSLSFAQQEENLDHICGKFYFVKKKAFQSSSINENEKKLICGSNTPGWENIPQKQALRQLGLSLEKRGFHSWSKETVKNKIIINTGEKSKVQNFTFNDVPLDFENVTHKALLDRPITADVLDEVKAWTTKRLSALGYPCAQVHVSASYKENTLKIDVNQGPYVNIKSIEREDVKGLRQSALTRYDAIKVGETYNGDYIDLTSRRLSASGLVSYSFFKHQCENKEDIGKIYHSVLIDKPQSLIFAIGASSEEFPLFKIFWNHSRLDKNASSAQAEIHLSPITKSLNSEMQIYLFDSLPRFYFFPSLLIEHKREDVFTALFQKYKLGVGYFHDFTNHQLGAKFAPTYNFERTFKGPNVKSVNYLSFESSLSLTSHYFEYFQFSPRAGYRLDLFWSSRQEGLGSKLSGDKFTLRGKYLLNIGSFDPPVVVFGVRGEASLLSVDSISNAPQSLRVYLGGIDSIRGFARKSINNGNLGYRSSLYLGLEARLTSLLPYKLQPYLFVDLAKVGTEVGKLTNATLYSPGIGTRWESPIGTFRVSAAKGMISNRGKELKNTLEEWNYFLSYGKEF